MRVLVLGAGLQGAACAFDLLETTDATVTLADNRLGGVPRFLDRFENRLHRIELDVRDEHRLRRELDENAAVASALPYYYNGDVARAAVEAGVHFADLGGNTAIVRQQQQLDPQAKQRGITVVPDCGLAPGMVNILGADGIGRLEAVESVAMYVGGLPQHPEPPLNYQIVYSLEGALDYYTTRSWVLRHGRPTQVEALTGVEHLSFPEPIGTLEAFHTAGGLSTMPWEYEGRVERMEYKTLRYPGHAAIMKAIRDLGLLDLEPVAVKDAMVRPRDVFVSVVDPKLRKPDGNDLVAFKVVVAGRRSGEPATVVYRLEDFWDAQHGISAMMRVTGYSLSITSQMQLDGRIGPAGVRPAYQATPAGPYVEELRRRGIAIEIEETG